ncbi:hypothetical protein B4907_13830 [Yersinia kristensenii]|nr:hypothetical protein B4907_13830 [Yersinia kristensenii]
MFIIVATIVAAPSSNANPQGTHLSVDRATWLNKWTLRLNVAHNKNGGLKAIDCGNVKADLVGGRQNIRFADARLIETNDSLKLLAHIAKSGPYDVNVLSSDLKGGDQIRIKSYGCGEAYSAPYSLPQQPGQGCDMNSVAIDLGRLPPGANERIINNDLKIKCPGAAIIHLSVRPTELQFAPGARTTVEPNDNGVLVVQANRLTSVPLVFTTSVSDSSKAGEYTQSLVVTAEIQ